MTLTLLIIIFDILAAVAIVGVFKIFQYVVALAKDQAVTNGYLKELWMYYNDAAKEQADTNAKLDEMSAFLKLTFSKDFAKKVEDVIHIKENIPETVKVLCDDGKMHDLPVDVGW